jgi:hypothetical protein
MKHIYAGLCVIGFALAIGAFMWVMLWIVTHGWATWTLLVVLFCGLLYMCYRAFLEMFETEKT